MKVSWNAVLTTTLVLCALLTTGLVVRREFFAAPAGTRPATVEEPVFVENWQSLLADGTQLGPPHAPVQVIEFADLECVFCAKFHQTYEAARQRHPKDIALTFVHYPLPSHRFAVPAARAAECAGEQDRFPAMLDRLFKAQNEFGLKPWTELAVEAGVPDRALFEGCMKRQGPVAKIVAGQRWAERLNVKGTPTLVVNGWIVPGADAAQLERMIGAVLAGESPVSRN